MSNAAKKANVGVPSNSRTRPYSRTELAQIDEILTKQGDLALQVAVWLSAEGGLRASEVSSLTLAGIDLEQHRVLVKDRTSQQRYGYYREQTEKYLRQWLLKRKSDCAHQFLLHDYGGKPFNPSVISIRFRRAARKAGIVNPTFHRLYRHSLRMVSTRSLSWVCADGAVRQMTKGPGAKATDRHLSGPHKEAEALANFLRTINGDQPPC